MYSMAIEHMLRSEKVQNCSWQVYVNTSTYAVNYVYAIYSVQVRYITLNCTCCALIIP